MIDIFLKGGNKENKAMSIQALIDSGSTFNLVSRAIALRMKRDWPTLRSRNSEKGNLPSVRVASGAMVQASECFMIRLSRNGKANTEDLPFYVFKGLPVDVIIGNDTCLKWNAILSWKDLTWKYTTSDGITTCVHWAMKYGPHWRGGANLIAKKDYVIRPGSQQKLQIELQDGDIKEQGICGDFGYITRQNITGKLFDVPLGVEDKLPTWMQVRNRQPHPVCIKKGEIVALFHSRTACGVFDAPDIDPSRDDIIKEKLQAKDARMLKKKQDLELQRIHEHEMAHGYVRLVQPDKPDADKDTASTIKPLCSCCNKDVCPIPEGDLKLEWERKEKDVLAMGIDLRVPRRWRTLCEVNKLIDWSLKWTSVINKDGLLAPDRVLKHSTSCSIETSEDPCFKARPDKSSLAQNWKLKR